MDLPEAGLHFYDPRVEIERHTTILPHWEQPGATCFVTFRLADSIPRSKLDAWKAERDAVDGCESSSHGRRKSSASIISRFSATIDRWLDQGHGGCVLRDAIVARVVGDALKFFENQRSIQHVWVVMPNHVHSLFTLLRGWKLDQMMHSWKSFTASKINALLGRRGTLWQRDYFDRLIRDADHFENCVRYIRRNPTNAKLRQGEYLLFESQWVKMRVP